MVHSFYFSKNVILGKIPWRRERLPTPVFWPGEFHGLYSPWVTKSQTWLSDFHFISWGIVSITGYQIYPKDRKSPPVVTGSSLCFLCVWHVWSFLVVEIQLYEYLNLSILGPRLQPATHEDVHWLRVNWQQPPPGICPPWASSLDFIVGFVHVVQISTGIMNLDFIQITHENDWGHFW